MEELTTAAAPIIITDLLAFQYPQDRRQQFKARPANNSLMVVPRKKEVSQPRTHSQQDPIVKWMVIKMEQLGFRISPRRELTSYRRGLAQTCSKSLRAQALIIANEGISRIDNFKMVLAAIWATKCWVRQPVENTNNRTNKKAKAAASSRTENNRWTSTNSLM